MFKKHVILFASQVFTIYCVYIKSGQSSTVIENIHTIIAAAAAKFNYDQLNHLFILIQKASDP